MAHIFFFKRVNGDRLSLTLFEREREARQGRARQGRAFEGERGKGKAG